MKVEFYKMTDEERDELTEMCGKTIRWIEEGRSTGYISDKLHLHPRQVEENIDEMLYVLRNQVGKWRFFKMLFRK